MEIFRNFYVTPSAYHNPEKKKIPIPFGIGIGGDNRTRICDLLRVKQALYRLSYASVLVTRTGLEPVLPP